MSKFLDVLKGAHGFIGRLGGKKFVVSVIGLVAVVVSSLGWLDAALVEKYSGWLIAYVGAQWVADKVTDGATESPK